MFDGKILTTYNQSMNKPHPHANVSDWQKYLKQFIGKMATKAMAESVRQKLIAKSQVKLITKVDRIKKTISHDSLAMDARIAAKEVNSRIQNWNYGAKPSIHEQRLGDYLANDEGQYSRSCKYTKYSYDPLYTSFVILARPKNGLIYRRGFSGKINSSIVKAPKGMVFEIDGNGLLLRRKSDGMDFHLNGQILERKDFATYVRAEMATNFKLRLDAKRRDKREKYLQKLFTRDLKTTMVTLHDSRKAGNCVEGSLQFAEWRLKISRQEILNGGHLFKVCAKKLVDSGDQRAIAAAKVAWQRETMVCI